MFGFCALLFVRFNGSEVILEHAMPFKTLLCIIGSVCRDAGSN
jgi:hypothetical protein